jgi:hypothetical protein
MTRLLRDECRNRVNIVVGALREFGDCTLLSDEEDTSAESGQKRKGGDDGGERERVNEGIGVKPEKVEM